MPNDTAPPSSPDFVILDEVAPWPPPPPTLCADFDEDCNAESELAAVRCWLLDPSQGICPYVD